MPSWQPRIAVIGAGFGGVAAAARLLRDGYRDITVLERDEGVGGVWRANHYPGSECDVPSHLYSLSFHPKPDWTQRYGGQGEIQRYIEDVAQTHGVTEHLRLRTEVSDCRWDDESGVWRLQVRPLDGEPEELVADVVIAACGQLSAPAVPQLPGLDSFAGPAFHSARWQHDVPLKGRKVAVVGTGASAIQFVPEVAGQAGHLTLFQRSAPYIIKKPQRAYSATELAIFAKVPGTLKASRARQYLYHEALGVPFVIAPALMAIPTITWRRRLNRLVKDPQLRAKLVPDYKMGCKRLLRSNNWYQTLTRPNVEVVSEKITEVTPTGVRTADGVEHEADVLIFGTGFAATDFLTPMSVTGRGGQDLHERWRDGANAYLGTAVSGFPNFFLLYGPGTNLGHSSILFMIESQLSWVRGALRAMRDGGLKWVDVRPEVASEADLQFRRDSAHTVWETGCSSWYTVDGRNINNWPHTTINFRRRTAHFQLTDVLTAPRHPGHAYTSEPAATAGEAS